MAAAWHICILIQLLTGNGTLKCFGEPGWQQCFIRSTQVPWHAKARALQFSSSLSISIMPCSSLNCGLSSTSIFFSNYIDFSKLQCPSVDFQLYSKNLQCERKNKTHCALASYTIRPFTEQNRDIRAKNIWKYCSYFKNKQKLSF